MIQFFFKRLGFMVGTMIVVSILLFLLLEIDVENVAVSVLGPYSNDEQRRLWLEAHGYFEPLWARYGTWLMNFASGEFGQSIRFNVPVAQVLCPGSGIPPSWDSGPSP